MGSLAKLLQGTNLCRNLYRITIFATTISEITFSGRNVFLCFYLLE